MAVAADTVADNDERVASSIKHTQFKTRLTKPYQYGHISTLFMCKMAEKPYSLGLHIPIWPI